MGKRLTRKEIRKRDPITESLIKIWKYGSENRKKMAWFAVGVLLLAVVVIAGESVWRRSTSSRSAAMRKAMDTYRAPVATVDPTGKTAPPAGSFPTSEAKYTAAVKEFQSLAKQYSSSAEGAWSQYYEGLCLRELGRYGESAPLFRKVGEVASDKILKDAARMALAETLRAGGKFDEALSVYDQLSKDPKSVIPPEAASYAKALCLRDAGREKEAYDLLVRTRGDLEAVSAEESGGSPYTYRIGMLIETLKAVLEAKGVKV